MNSMNLNNKQWIDIMKYILLLSAFSTTYVNVTLFVKNIYLCLTWCTLFDNSIMKLFEYHKYKSKSNKNDERKKSINAHSKQKNIALDKKRFFFPFCVYILFKNMHIKILFIYKHIWDQNAWNINFIYRYCAFWLYLSSLVVFFIVIFFITPFILCI